MSVVRSDFVSLGHAGGQWNAVVKVNAEGVRDRAAPGALWVIEHTRVADRAPGPILALQRRALRREPKRSDWCYVVAEPEGTILRAGVLEDCAGCHASTADSIFTGATP